MRPEQLILSGFGPFGERVEVDFSAFGNSELFLIEGQTGAGKTSLLDGMCFALYGTVPGVRAEIGVPLRSTHARADVPTEASLVFSLGAARYRVVRNPEYVRAKLRGTGLAKQPAGALLERFEGASWAVVTSGTKQVTASIEELLGLSVEQFKQVLLMPQGEFREFLIAPSAQKEALLEKLFGTSTYREVVEVLKRQRAQLEDEGRAARQKREGLLEASGCASLEELRARREAEAARIPVLAERHAAARAAHQSARAAHDQARARQLAAQALLEARGALAALEARREELDRARLRLANARRAAPVLERAQRERECLQELERRDEALLQARAGLVRCEAAHLEAREAAAGTAELEAREAELVARATFLEGLAVLEARASEGRARLAKTARERSAAEATLASQRAELASLVATREALSGRAVALEGVSERLAESRATERHAREKVELRARLEQERESFRKASADVSAAKEAEERARRSLEAAGSHAAAGRAAREAQLAAQLALGLEDGTPCPVCGAEAHPRPAEASGALVPLEEVERRESEVDRLRALHERALAALSESEVRREGIRANGEALRTSLGEAADEPLAIWRERAEQAQAERSRLEEEAEAARVVRARLEAARADLEQAQARESAAREVLARLTQELASQEEQSARDQAELAPHLPDGQTAEVLKRQAQAERAGVEQQRRALAARAQQAELEVQAMRERVAAQDLERERCRVEHAAAAEALEAALATAGFDSADEARAQSVPALEQERLAEELSAFESAVERAKGTLAAREAALGEVPPEGLSPLEPLALAMEQAEAAQQALSDEHAAAVAGLSTLEQNLARIDALEASFGEVERRLSVVGQLAKVLGGDNPSKLSLQRFVLASRMDEVALVASERLLKMSRGRYELVRSDDVRHKGQQSGLDLMVRDRQIGQDRYVHSLSGGEMFLASLSLALALADVVTRRRGAIRLDALFIDEGFGTLDDETLDLVMRTLEDLRLGGRLIGIISHVSELKQRISARISVTRAGGEGGAMVRVVA